MLLHNQIKTWEDLNRAVNIQDATVLVVDDALINPIEIYLIVKKNKGFLGKEVFQCKDIKGEMRLIRIFTLSELGLSRFFDCIKNRSIGNKNLLEMSGEDKLFFFLHLLFVVAQKESWMTKRIEEKEKERLDLSSREELYSKYLDILTNRKVKITPVGYMKFDKRLKRLISKASIMRTVLNRGIRKVYIRHYFNNKERKVNRHGYCDTEVFLQRLEEENEGIEDIRFINEDNSRTWTSLVKATYKGMPCFIKGNEPPQDSSVPNEVNIQKKILELNNAKSHFLKMIKADAEGKWIMYPYVQGDTLNKYLENNKLNTEMLKKLGNFLVSIVDDMHEMDMCYNDLRSNNIMIYSDEITGENEFVLIDFGTATLKDVKLWNTDTYIGRFFAQGVCDKNRYNEYLIDDAASAYLVYIGAGGDPTDGVSQKLEERIGRLYYVF